MLAPSSGLHSERYRPARYTRDTQQARAAAAAPPAKQVLCDKCNRALQLKQEKLAAFEPKVEVSEYIYVCV